MMAEPYARGRGAQIRRHVFFASCVPGTEEALLGEARRLRFGRVEAQVGGVRFEGPESEGWRACLQLRTAVRLYRRLARFPAATAEELYAGTKAVPWDELLGPGETFAVDAKVSESAHPHSGYVALKVKDAVADWFRERHGARPSVDPTGPDVRLSAHLFRDRCTLSLDIAGRSLHRRGYRLAASEAPIGECLAAAAVLLSGWDRRSPFLDPFCGSGTIPIEAALLASDVAPGLLSDDFAFARRPGFDRGRWDAMRSDARRAVREPRRLIVRGSDSDPAVVEAARRNARAAGVGDLVRFETADARDFAPTPGWGATVVSNPPYGVRLEDETSLLPLYEAMGRVFKERCRGFHVFLFMASGRLARAFKLKPDHYWPLVHGGLPLRLCRYEIR
ncbi:MAG: RNA methyltransferase [Deltaproteobacteria bacterium]|nr:RNA methyltransferase [Deltaproteobacteria bacterium]